MNKVAKTSPRSKPKTKASSLASAVKPAKKRSKVSVAKKPLKNPTKAEIERSRIAMAKIADEFEAKQAALGIEEPKPVIVPLAEVEVLAAKAVKTIKAKRSASPEKKARKLALVAKILEQARRNGGVPKGGVFDLKYPFGLDVIYIDWKAVLR